MAKPFLDFGDVGLVIERIGGGRRAQGVSADLEPELRRVGAHQPIYAIGRNRPFKLAGAVVADRTKQRAAFISAVPGGIEAIVDKPVGPRMQRQVAGLSAFAGHLEMRHAFPRVAEILHLQLAQLLAPQRVEQEGGENGAVALALDCVVRRRVQQLARLMIAKGWGLYDAFRRTFVGGMVMITAGVEAMPVEQRRSLLQRVRAFDAFANDNDPHGEHDFGSIDEGGVRCFWKIDLYDRNTEFGSPDPTDPAVTTRVLTIMRAEEY